MRKICIILVVLLVGLGAVLWLEPQDRDPWDFTVEIPFTDETNPFSEDHLSARLQRISLLVEEVVHGQIQIDDLHLVLADGFVVSERELRASYPHLVDTSNKEYAPVLLALTKVSMDEYWSSLLGRYVSETKTIELYPFMFEAVGVEDTDALIDVVLAHELAHVWQDQRFGVFEHEGVESTAESDLARAAVLEGTAEFISREVARRLGAEAAFDLVASKRDKQGAKKTGTPTQRALTRWRRWVYGEGLRFVESVHAKLGPAGTWERLFAETPSSVWSVEHPHAWMDQGWTEVPDLDAWAERILWTLEAVRPPFAFLSKWGHRPLLREDIEDRLVLAGQSLASGPWAQCRGGALFAGTPQRGPMAGTDFLMRAWRFATPGEALEARRILERGFEEVGPRAWAGNEVEDAVGAPRLLGRPDGALVRSSLVFDDAPLHAQEGAWGLQVHGSLLFEVMCWRDGIGPVLLDLLDAAVAAWADAKTIDAAMAGTPPSTSVYARLGDLRGDPSGELQPVDAEDPTCLRDEILARQLAAADGERGVLAWLLEQPEAVTAWMTALGPAAGREKEKGVERGLILAAALAHRDDAVKRFALGAIAERRCHLPPWNSESLAHVVALATHEDAWVRSAAVRAAETLSEQEPFGEQIIDMLASDASPAVRASLAVSREVLNSRQRRILRQLAGDAHSAVKRAAEAKEIDWRNAQDRFIDRIRSVALRDEDEKPPPKGDDRIDQEAAAEAIFEAVMSAAMHKDQGDLARRIRKFLIEGDADLRAMALFSIQFLGDEREQFLPELVHAFDSPLPRRMATMGLCKGGLDLGVAYDHLLPMLDHPWWRVDVLRSMAANDLRLKPEDFKRVVAWMDAPDLQLRSAAALVVLGTDPDDVRPMQRLDRAWGLLPVEWRVQILAAALAHRPGAETTTRMRLRALYSGFTEERYAVFKSIEAAVLDEVYMVALLDGMGRVGPVVADEFWSEFLCAASCLSGEDKGRAREMLTEHLERWCNPGRMPRINGDMLVAYTWPDLGESRDFVQALDRCLLQSDPSILRYAIALIRSNVDAEKYPESADVQEALNRIFSLQGAPEDLPLVAELEFTDMLVDREAVSPEAIKAVLLRAASTRPQYSRIDVEALVKGHEDRVAVAIRLVPQLLDLGTRRSVDTALEVLEVAGPKARELLPRLRELAGGALPTWRSSIDDVIRTIEGADDGDS